MSSGTMRQTGVEMLAFPPIVRFGGAACLVAWFLLIYSGEIWGLDYAESAASVVSLTLLSLGACFVTLMTVNLFHVKISDTPRRPTLYFFILGFVLSFATTGIALRYLLPQAVYHLSCIVAGVAGALLLITCIRQFSVHSPKDILISYGIIFLIGIFIYAFSFYVPQVLRTPLLCLLPLLACLFFAIDDPDRDNTALFVVDEDQKTPVAWRTIVMLSVFIFSSCIIRGYLPLSMDNEFFSYIRSFSVIFMFITVSGLLVFTALLPNHFDFSNILRIVLLMGVIFFALVPIFGLVNPFVLALTDAYRGVCTLVSITFIASMARKTPLLGLKNVVGGLAFYVISGLLGWFIGSLLYSQALGEGTLRVISTLQCVLVLIVFLVLYRQSEISWFMNLPDIDFPDAAGEQALMSEGSEKAVTSGRWRQRCEKLVKNYNLTSREAEVFFLLAKGYKIQNISDKLSISYNTTRAHVRSIYQKCGVHSQTEFVELVERGPSSPAVPTE